MKVRKSWKIIKRHKDPITCTDVYGQRIAE